MAGGIITKIALGTSTTDVEEDFYGFYYNLSMTAGQENRFDAKNTNHENPKDPPPVGKYFVKGWWTDEKDKPVKEVLIGQKVKFHVQMDKSKVPANSKVNFILKDWDGMLNQDDPITLYSTVKNPKTNAYPEINELVTDANGKASLAVTLTDGLVQFIEDDGENEIELYFDCNYYDISDKEREVLDLPEAESDYLIVYEKEEIITVLIELPHSSYTDKLNRKGLGGHTAIIIGDEYYDFGPQPGLPFKSDGRPWWDKMATSGNLTKQDILDILNDQNQRISWNIVGRVCLIDIHLRGSEKTKIENWWIDRYNNLGTYSVIPVLGEQCTTAVKISINENSSLFDLYNSKTISIKGFIETAQSPEGFLDLLLNSGRNTYGQNKNEKLTITKEYAQIN